MLRWLKWWCRMRLVQQISPWRWECGPTWNGLLSLLNQLAAVSSNWNRCRGHKWGWHSVLPQLARAAKWVLLNQARLAIYWIQNRKTSKQLSRCITGICPRNCKNMEVGWMTHWRNASKSMPICVMRDLAPMLRHGSLLMSREKLPSVGMKLVIWRRGWNSPELAPITRVIRFYERMQLHIGRSVCQTDVLVNHVDCITNATPKSSMARSALRSTVTGPSRPARVPRTRRQLIASSSGTLAFGRIPFSTVRIAIEREKKVSNMRIHLSGATCSRFRSLALFLH